MRRWSSITSVSTFVSLSTLLLGGCAIVDNVGAHTDTLNESIADYNAYSILLNIVRASESEPLNFVAVTQASPSTGFTGNATVPTFTFMPYKLASYGISGNSITGTTSDALTVQPVDDPQSWQALLTPIDVGTIGFFIKQGYQPELLFWLFVDRIRICGDSNCKNYEVLVNDPDDGTSFEKFAGLLLELMHSGLTIEIERGRPKSGTTPSSKICFDRSAALFADEAKRRLPLAPGRAGSTPYTPSELPKPDNCSKSWLAGKQDDSGSGSDSSKGGASIPQPIYVYLNYLSPNKVPKIKSKDSTSAWFDLPPDLPYFAAKAASTILTRDKLVSKSTKIKIQFSTRSAYGVYLFLGRLLNREKVSNVPLRLEYTGDNTSILDIVNNHLSNCYTQLVYNSVQYCVPRDAYNTKRTFTILHQLVGLNIAYTATPATLNVRTIP